MSHKTKPITANHSVSEIDISGVYLKRGSAYLFLAPSVIDTGIISASWLVVYLAEIYVAGPRIYLVLYNPLTENTETIEYDATLLFFACIDEAALFGRADLFHSLRRSGPPGAQPGPADAPAPC